ncbi:hypothetical protein G9C98_005385 [Cotesia typhae]|uniref:Aminotransferase class V domain-containing protein n=1 Tax=Cotesia typhae TaxID=2053667 RepID=A0A8J5RCI3_9HYME|nr:hypothetical protein G9C98_005385 [Cotesia typhae]
MQSFALTIKKAGVLKPVSDELLQSMKVPKRLLLGPGPSNLSERVIKAISNPLLGHMHLETFKMMDDIKVGLQYAFQTNNRLTLAISATGHSGMEASLANLLEPTDTILIIKAGLWGERAQEIAKRIGARVTVTLEEFEAAIIKYKPAVVFLTHSESSTGLKQPLIGFGDVVRRRKLFLRKTKSPVFYWDMEELGNYWNCFSEPVRRYHHTISATLVYGLREGLAQLAEEGLEASWNRHKLAAKKLQEGLKARKLEFFVKEPENRLNTITAIVVPPGVDPQLVTRRMMKK